MKTNIVSNIIRSMEITGAELRAWHLHYVADIGVWQCSDTLHGIIRQGLTDEQAAYLLESNKTLANSNHGLKSLWFETKRRSVYDEAFGF